MDIAHLVEGLNDPQREAVTAAPGHALVLAGAGSGKTRVLVHRIAYLVQALGVPLPSILAVTFTNKAAAEMRGRLAQLLPAADPRSLWVGTFHGLAHRLLRLHWREVGLNEHFQILDSDDQQRLLRRLMKEEQIDETRWPVKQVLWFINGKKDEGLRAAHVEPLPDPYNQTMVRIYQAYEQHCQRAGLVDFAELLLRAFELWQQHPDLLQHYQQRFQHILVDEFQDTNTIQYAWLRLLIGPQSFGMVVGDDDQSIYGWRGAKIENIHRFKQDFPGAHLIRLEQNYRSTGTILQAANALISCNQGRLGKQLWTTGEQGEPIALYAAFNELDEARYVVQQISAGRPHDIQYQDVALLYRSNAQSRVLEDALIHAGIPYRIYGGQRFFERAEIKDCLAYLRLMANPDNDSGLERVINWPTRGIGERTVETLRQHARQAESSLWWALRHCVEQALLPARARSMCERFVALIEQLQSDTANFSLAQQVQHVLQHSGLIEQYQKEKGEKGRSRLENLDELVSAAKQFEEGYEDTLPVLAAFLAHAALEAGEGQAPEFEDSVQLMTLHSAKGLEFKWVFLVGLEETLFPHQMALNEEGRIEEERRLCYVGMTRARQQLWLTYAESRRLHGTESYRSPSRFLREIPDDLMHHVRLSTSTRTTTPRATLADDELSATGFQLGQRVRHPKFGEGIIVNYEGSGAQACLKVQFDLAGEKNLMLAYAKLEIV